MKIAIILFVVLVLSSLIGAGVYYFVYYKPTLNGSDKNASSETGTENETGGESSPTSQPDVVQDPKWVALSGYDFPHNDIGAPFTDMTEESCIDKCKTTTNCVAAMFSPSEKKCWLKSDLGTSNENKDRTILLPPTPINSHVNKFTMKPNKDHVGDDIGCFRDGTPLEHCSALCSVHKGCKAYNKVGNLGDVWEKGGCCVKTADSPVTDAYRIDLHSN